MTHAQAAPPRRRRWPWVVGILAVVVIILGTLAWAALDLVRAAPVVKDAASGAQADVTTAKAALTAGDYAKARTAADAATAKVADATSAASSLPIRLVGMVPLLGQPVRDLQHLLDAGEQLTAAASTLVDVYGEATGKKPGSSKVFANGQVDLSQLAGLTGQVEQVQSELTGAEDSLNAVQANLPGTAVLALARDDALAQVTPLKQTIDTAVPALQQLPQALGGSGTKRYLVTLLNPAELRTTGGAPLALAVAQFDNGRLTITDSGSWGDVLGNPSPATLAKKWDRVAQPPFIKLSDQRVVFTNANNHPDFPTSAQDLMRAWEAYGKEPVDGVISLDVGAIKALLAATGPVQSSGYGQITADNLGQVLLVDAYEKFGNAGQDERQRLNQELLTQVLGRLIGGDGSLSVAQAVLGTAPQRHLQLYMADPTLQQAIVDAGLSGELVAPTSGDRIAVYSSNSNYSKLDTFQKRAITQDVTLAADGSATVKRVIAVTNAVPKDFGKDGVHGSTSADAFPTTPNEEGAFYEERVFRATFFIYVPSNATITSTGGSWPINPRLWDDGKGGKLIRTSGTIEPGKTAQMVVSYSLPAGSFPTGPLTYQALLEPQPMYVTPTVTVNVTAPQGLSLSTSGTTEGWVPSGTGATLTRPMDVRVESTAAFGS